MQNQGCLKVHFVYYVPQRKTLVKWGVPKTSQHNIIIHVHLFHLNSALVHDLLFEHNIFKCLFKYFSLSCVLQMNLRPIQQMLIDHKQINIAI